MPSIIKSALRQNSANACGAFVSLDLEINEGSFHPVTVN